MIDPLDERERAFAALMPIAQGTSAALARVEEAVEDERRLTTPLRARFHATQHASLNGTSRFAYAVRELGEMLDEHPSARRISSEPQQAQSIYMWLLAERYVLRIKHDLDEIVDPGTATLFSLEPEAGPVIVFLTWEIGADGKMRAIGFATVDEPKWTITLDELLRAEAEPPAPIKPQRPQVTVRSKQAPASDEEQAGRG
jgi:hypothetical protein